MSNFTVNWLLWNRNLLRVSGLLNPAYNVVGSRQDIYELHTQGRAGDGLDALQARLAYAHKQGRAHKAVMEGGASALLQPYVGLPRESALTTKQLIPLDMMVRLEGMGEDGRQHLATLRERGDLI